MRVPRSLLVAIVTGLLAFPVFFLARPFPYAGDSFREVDSKVLNYNFSMASPVSISDSFSLNLSLEHPPSWYEIHSFVNFTEDFQSYGPYGEYFLDIKISANGLPGPRVNLGNGWTSVPYGLTLSGELPQKENPSNFTGLRQGQNSVLLEFEFRSELETYGSGYYRLDLGPFYVSVKDNVSVQIVNVGLAGLVTLAVSIISVGLASLGRARKAVEKTPSPT